MTQERGTSRLHGEFKTPGGKLTAVDLAVRDGRLADVSVNGDFFLEPDEALADINAAMLGVGQGRALTASRPGSRTRASDAFPRGTGGSPRPSGLRRSRTG